MFAYLLDQTLASVKTLEIPLNHPFASDCPLENKINNFKQMNRFYHKNISTAVLVEIYVLSE